MFGAVLVVCPPGGKLSGSWLGSIGDHCIGDPAGGASENPGGMPVGVVYQAIGAAVRD